MAQQIARTRSETVVGEDLQSITKYRVALREALLIVRGQRPISANHDVSEGALQLRKIASRERSVLVQPRKPVKNLLLSVH